MMTMMMTQAHLLFRTRAWRTALLQRGLPHQHQLRRLPQEARTVLPMETATARLRRQLLLPSR